MKKLTPKLKAVALLVLFLFAGGCEHDNKDGIPYLWPEDGDDCNWFCKNK